MKRDLTFFLKLLPVLVLLGMIALAWVERIFAGGVL